jgi:peptidoglycan/LPS O-acetylase OafA/YrhL
MLDLLRALAAQTVCIGHAINFGNGKTVTNTPNVGVLLFFLLSGFVIAYTLSMKSADDDYGLVSFGIERFSRIYSAFLPAVLAIAAADYLMQYLGHPLPGDPTDLKTLLGNLTMRQGLPSGWGVSTFGSAGQLTSVAVEFHIYFFVGAIFFLLQGRGVLLCAAVAWLFSTMPLAYFSNNPPDSDRALFVMWLAGFAAYYVVKWMKPDAGQTALSGMAFVGLTWHWATHRTPNDYDISNYPAFALAFLALVIFTQSGRLLGRSVSHIIRTAADYSFSLFLIHVTILKMVFMLPGPAPVKILCGILIANVVSVAFALAFERHYRRIAQMIKDALLPVRNSTAST